MTASPADNPARSPARSRRPLLDRSHCATPVASPSSSRYCHRNMTAGHVGSGHEGERVTRAAVERVVAALSQRDREILADVTRVRVLTGRQIERLHFANLAGTHRDRKRRRGPARLPTLRRKVVGYLDLVERGEKGPDEEVLPRVLVSVPDKQRCRAVRQLVRGLPPPADELFVVTLHDLVVAKLGEVLRE